MSKQPKTSVSVTISGDLIHHVRFLFQHGVREYLRGNVVRHRMNAYTHDALPAYITAVASVEAYVNEVFFSNVYRSWFAKSPLWHLRSDWLEKVNLREKLILIAELLFRYSLDSGTPPLQDFHTLIRLRNEIVHYKQHRDTPSFIKDLVHRDIALYPSIPEGVEDKLSQPWPWLVQCTEGIRWAHNTACRMVHAMVETIPSDAKEYERRGLNDWATYDHFEFVASEASNMLSNFVEIKESEARALFVSLGINPDTDYPG